jgi:hypothetical protein
MQDTFRGFCGRSLVTRPSCFPPCYQNFGQNSGRCHAKRSIPAFVRQRKYGDSSSPLAPQNDGRWDFWQGSEFSHSSRGAGGRVVFTISGSRPVGMGGCLKKTVSFVSSVATVSFPCVTIKKQSAFTGSAEVRAFCVPLRLFSPGTTNRGVRRQLRATSADG